MIVLRQRQSDSCFSVTKISRNVGNQGLFKYRRNRGWLSQEVQRSCQEEGEDKDKGKEQNDHKIGENGVPIPGSKTVAQNGSTEQVDVENSNSGKGNGNMYYHESNNTKWYYDFY